MKRSILVLVICLAPAALFAAPGGPWGAYGPGQFGDMRPVEAGPFYAAEILKVESEMGSQKLGDFDIAAMAALRDRLDVAAQKDAYVRRISMESYFLPGLGQFETGDAGSGLGFLALDLATWTGTLIGAYYLLPDDVRFDHVDYFHNSFSTISNAWNGHSFVDYLPSLGVMLGGAIVDQIIRHWSSGTAKREATRLVDAGTVTFTPKLGIGFMGFGLKY